MIGHALPLLIFALTYAALALGKLPLLRIDRTGAALVGAVAMVACGALSERAAIGAVDFNTLGLLLGMMMVIANLRLSGAINYLARKLFGRAHSGFALLALTVGLSGVLAAFFVNDVICLVLTPVIIETAAEAGVAPIPLLLGLATAANVGSAATITGNPQNMIVAGFAHLSYSRFLHSLMPGALAGLVIVFAVVALVWCRTLADAGSGARSNRRRIRISVPLAIKAVLIALGTLGGFAAGLPTALVALSGGALTLITRRIRPQRIYRQIDWTLLLMFGCLFVVVGGLGATGLPKRVLELIGPARLTHPPVLVSVTAVLSNLVSNVPTVLLFRPLYPLLGNSPRIALIVASSSTYAGNLTVLGSIANLIVIENAGRQGIHISFAQYLAVGVPITILTTAAGLLLLR